ncbi:alginate lyase family protein [Cyclobacterium salsum]|uniref:alginate lyase family protein n=1 Tax=Cyclobacterium salsum TaxID=2666329 RepID=UPI0013919D1D|nr:alginate lyase family protein [Cyclobacterium salsum]
MKLILAFLSPFFGLSEPGISTEFSTLLHPEVIRELDNTKVPPNLKNMLKREWSLIRRDEPNPISEIHYEGLLDNNPARIKTVRHLEDMDKIALFYWHYALYKDPHSLKKMIDFSLSWASSYQADGNPINENKLLPVVYAYTFLSPHLDSWQQNILAEWFKKLAKAEMGNDRVPLNNWETKRINLVGTIGLLLEDESMVFWAEKKAAYYVENALFSDGSSADIRQRDALSYHVSGLKPLLQFLISLEREKGLGRDFFYKETADGASVARSLDFVMPYARGEKIYRQWENSKVKLDQERAAAGLEKYQPGVAYDPEKSYETMAMAGFFDAKYQINSCDLPLCTLMSTIR